MNQNILGEPKALRHKLSRSWPQETVDQKAESQSGKLLATWDDTRHIWCVPDWQHLNRRPIVEIQENISLLQKVGFRETDGWGAIEWLPSLHALLPGSSPAEVLTIDSEFVLGAAGQEFGRLRRD